MHIHSILSIYNSKTTCLTLTPPNFHLKLWGFGGGAPEKILRFCKALSIILIIENLAKKREGSGSCQMFARLSKYRA